DWMASRKVAPGPNDTYGHAESGAAALAHGATYTLPFLLITQHPLAVLVSGGTHVLIDHYRLAALVRWVGSYLAAAADTVPWQVARTSQRVPPAVPPGAATALPIVAAPALPLGIPAATLAATARPTPRPPKAYRPCTAFLCL